MRVGSGVVLSLLSSFLPLAFAQTHSDCNPLEKSSCPSDTGLNAKSIKTDFTQGASDDWKVTAGEISYGSQGAEFTISESGQAPTIATNFYFLFGQMSIMMRAAPGTGIISSVVMESDDLDEIDLEWLGGNNAEVESNYFGKGNTSTYDRAVYHGMPDTQNRMHNYTIVWTSSFTTWYLDGTAVRTLNYQDAVAGQNYPQTPMNLRIGTWAGGDKNNDEGTIGWAGGVTNYNDGPFTMYVESVEIINYSPAESYSYGDNSGAWRSIDLEGGEVNSNQDGAYASPTTSNTATTSTRAGMWWTESAAAVQKAAGGAYMESANAGRCLVVAVVGVVAGLMLF
ncbi:glycoside hydrolase family 16 protein [Aplosporella prunicola CBS 121167]|uniref:chitinase n=1 Tax=Aplosporella prunicola CBS 121167 TaxID=1176127 RepID=A0A6A6BUI1_9PEZI|nr:glycoside hydrolase family 16 protein [Aplosporella prunicola CBS 121167]KAF2146311.1 glycoside hydrolase family 16 protein [Aplosporella prunicola CBS 121167]